MADGPSVSLVQTHATDIKYTFSVYRTKSFYQLLSFVARMCNVSLQKGLLSLTERHAIVIPSKSGLDALDV